MLLRFAVMVANMTASSSAESAAGHSLVVGEKILLSLWLRGILPVYWECIRERYITLYRRIKHTPKLSILLISPFAHLV